MTSIAYRDRGRPSGLGRSDAPRMLRSPRPRHRTTPLERSLLLLIIVLVPLQDYLPSVAGFSVIYLIFGVAAFYALLYRYRALARTWTHPVFLTAYVLCAVLSLIEFAHPRAIYFEINRFAQMLASAIVVASLCRDRRALRTCLYGYILSLIHI